MMHALPCDAVRVDFSHLSMFDVRGAFHFTSNRYNGAVVILSIKYYNTAKWRGVLNNVREQT
jgi:hypothetical protein